MFVLLFRYFALRVDFRAAFFAPVFFASVALSVDFLANFDVVLCLTVFGVASAAKIIGCSVGARASGIKWRESLAIGFGLNARGAMEIILGTLALNAGLIGQPIFVALVIMALVTSLTSGPMMRRVSVCRATARADRLPTSGGPSMTTRPARSQRWASK